MIRRAVAPELHRLLAEYPVVTVLGPRQAGKTTLVRSEMPDFDYCNLENPELRTLSLEDPKTLLSRFPEPTIIDEIQHAPELLSYIQVIVDEERRNGRFVLTGSHQLGVRQAVGQSLAGRTAVLNLYPFSIAELRDVRQGYSAWDHAFEGFLPRIHDQGQQPSTAYANYYQTYVERDVRQLINLKDVRLFENLVRLLAGRVGQCLNKSSLADDLGTSPRTVGDWLSILEASFLVYRLPPYFEDFGKRMIKSPKYYFVETGLLCYILGIRSPDQVSRDPLVGAIFENLVVGEFLKSQANKGHRPEMYFYRDSNHVEVGLLVPKAGGFDAVEIKSAATYRSNLLTGLNRIASIAPNVLSRTLVYRGDRLTFSNGVQALPFDQVDQMDNADS
ncbi:MAG: ATP-binding protein [Gammaproteobacteria bacterium]|nr:ATP-binding protein [Gammaproteobacteria bacterium]